MKKAKIVLSAVALLAVVGGAFAFKASRQLNVFYTNDPVNNICSYTTRTLLTTDPQAPGVPFTTRLTTTTTLTTTLCPVITVKNSI